MNRNYLIRCYFAALKFDNLLAIEFFQNSREMLCYNRSKLVKRIVIFVVRQVFDSHCKISYLKQLIIVVSCLRFYWLGDACYVDDKHSADD